MDLYILFACSLLLLGTALIVQYFQKKSAFNQQLTNIKKQRLFTRKEALFYSVLCHACDGKAIVFGKLSVADIDQVKCNLNLQDSKPKPYKAHKMVFDYIICNRTDLSVIAVVSLVKGEDIKEKSVLKLKAACSKAGLILHCYPTDYDDFNSVRNDLFN